MLTDDKLQAIFKSFDTDNSGEITQENIREAFSKIGKTISDEEVAVIMQEHDSDSNKNISYDEFVQMMKCN